VTLIGYGMISTTLETFWTQTALFLNSGIGHFFAGFLFINLVFFQLTELEANSRHQEAESSSNVREYERALSGVQQEVTAYQTVLAQTQVGGCFVQQLK
jgi:hypothetical protein